MLNSNKVRIQYNNNQMIRLVNSKLAVLFTKLQYVNIYNHWLRQEVAKKRMEVVYTASFKNIINGFIKTF